MTSLSSLWRRRWQTRAMIRRHAALVALPVVLVILACSASAVLGMRYGDPVSMLKRSQYKGVSQLPLALALAVVLC